MTSHLAPLKRLGTQAWAGPYHRSRGCGGFEDVITSEQGGPQGDSHPVCLGGGRCVLTIAGSLPGGSGCSWSRLPPALSDVDRPQVSGPSALLLPEPPVSVSWFSAAMATASGSGKLRLAVFVVRARQLRTQIHAPPRCQGRKKRIYQDCRTLGVRSQRSLWGTLPFLQGPASSSPFRDHAPALQSSAFQQPRLPPSPQ